MSFFGDPAHGDNGPQRTSALLAQDTSQYSELKKFGGNNQTVSYNGVFSPKLVVEAAYSHARNEIQSRCRRWTPGTSPTSASSRTS